MAESVREERARGRRTSWFGGIVRLGDARPDLYGDLTHAECLAELLSLSERAWLAAGRKPPVPSPRSEWPGEVFECARDE